MRIPVLALLLTLLAWPVAAADLTGQASIIDGDTIDIHGERIRILDIDAPESRQTCTKPDGSEWRCGQFRQNCVDGESRASRPRNPAKRYPKRYPRNR
jgi:endonuclease YncB( thermonuclease family)